MSREAKRLLEWAPSRSLLASIRRFQRWSGKNPVSYLVRRVALYQHRFWSIVCACDIPITCQLGGGLLIPHPQGIVIHPCAVIGVNCLLFQQVTIGAHNGLTPVLGAHVDVGAGAKIIGRAMVHAHARIGANAVVTRDVPAWATAVGVPARIIRRHPSFMRRAS
jgi:serine O-acetyltransferase